MIPSLASPRLAKLAVFTLAGFCFHPLAAKADVKLNSLFSDHMVLQRAMPVPVWGGAAPGEEVSVEFAGQSKSAKADAAGKWRVTLDPLAASDQSRDMTVKSKSGGVKFSDVLVGEVWLAAGQSNMGSPLFAAHNAAVELPKAQDPQLRFFNIAKKTAAEPQSDVGGKWEPTTPETAKGFSAVAYFFAQELRQEQKCPVAILCGAWGGTSIFTWTSLEGLKMNPPITKYLGQWDKAVAQYQKVQANPQIVADYKTDLKKWQTEEGSVYAAKLKEYNETESKGKPMGEKPKPSRPEPVSPDPMGMPGPSKRPSTPTVSFNGMIAPLIPYAMRGVLWYQGEIDGSIGLEYRALMPRLIEDWRSQWKQPGDAGNFPFLFVQLPNCGIDKTPVATAGWAWVREAQLMALKSPRTGMAVTIDIGDPKNVHPGDKIDVGKRLALAARKVAYGEKIVASGPLYQDSAVEAGGKVRLRFTETGSGLAIGQSPWYAKGVEPYPKDKLIGFFIAGDDKNWVEADARIDGNSVVVSSPAVAKPAAVRYGWALSPRCNLYNKEGLPASPFRTDSW